ncbi:hypothetical protein WN48_04978 [Eufriesea mexicana]|uniref:uncharacterized protein LOC108550765 n=1 Tax=Eufriesea mexicana TaxID=516756 RepID=UPI00083C4323|nr:PREDICTED: uncharacterized protein LOC108550765 [Eufriesea mexicana]OAD55221.1 hypothetical protein WN48_04978 [Eufriesea mexicana]
MFHKFNAFTGSIQKATQLQALYPLSPRPLEKMQLPKILDSIKTQVARTEKLQKSNYSTADPRIVRLQKEFQVDLERPVYIYRGTKDKIIFGIMCVWTTLGCLTSIYAMYKLKQKF